MNELSIILFFVFGMPVLVTFLVMLLEVLDGKSVAKVILELFGIE